MCSVPREANKMKTEIISTMAVVAVMWGTGVTGDSLDQTRSEMPMEHARPGHQMNGHPMAPSIIDSKMRTNGPKSSIIRNATHGRSLRRFWTPCICSALR